MNQVSNGYSDEGVSFIVNLIWKVGEWINNNIFIIILVLIGIYIMLVIRKIYKDVKNNYTNKDLKYFILYDEDYVYIEYNVFLQRNFKRFVVANTNRGKKINFNKRIIYINQCITETAPSYYIQSNKRKRYWFRKQIRWNYTLTFEKEKSQFKSEYKYEDNRNYGNIIHSAPGSNNQITEGNGKSTIDIKIDYEKTKDDILNNSNISNVNKNTMIHVIDLIKDKKITKEDAKDSIDIFKRYKDEISGMTSIISLLIKLLGL